MSHRVFAQASLLTLALALSASAQQPLSQQQLTPQNSPSWDGPSVNMPSVNSGTVSGSVRTLDGRPVSGARVELRLIGPGPSQGNTYTNDNGMFEMYNIGAGEYELTATSGTSDSHERVHIVANDVTVNLRMNVAGQSAEPGATVSIAAMRVPEKARKEFSKAEENFNRNKLDEAGKHVEKALSIYPNYAQALVLRGILAINDQKVDEGTTVLQQAINADPSYGMAYVAMGAALNQQHKYAEAKQALDRGISLAADSWQAYFEMSKAAMGMNDYASALKNVDRAYSLLKQDFAPIHLLKAHALIGLQHYDEAVTELEQFLSRDPQNPNAQYARATLDKARAFAASTGGSK